MPVTITYEFVQQLMEQNALLLKQNENLTASVAELTETDHRGTPGAVKQKLPQQFQTAII